MKAVVAKKTAKPLPPWLQKAKDEGAKESKSGKKPTAAHEKGESKRFEAAEDKGAKPKGRPFADGGSTADLSTRDKDRDRAYARESMNAAAVKAGGKATDYDKNEAAIKADRDKNKYADGGRIKKPSNAATNPKAQARSDPKMAGNAKGRTNTMHMANGGKVK
jgi:hypothetical protein